MLNERRGRWVEAEADAEEAVRLAREIDQATIAGFCLSTLANVEAGLGRVDDARAHAREGLELVGAAHARNLAIYVNAALGRAELAADRPEAAIAALDLAAAEAVALGWREPNVVQFAGDRVEALVRLGREADARAALAQLADDVELTGCAWGAAVLERGRLLLAPADEVDGHAARALDFHARDGGLFERARTELAWGERLRRRRRRMDAREPLERALSELPRARRDAVGAPRRRRAGGCRRRPPGRRGGRAARPRGAVAARAEGRADGRPRDDQPRGRRGAVPVAEDDRAAPQPHLPQARRALPHRAGAAADGRRRVAVPRVVVATG